MKTSDLKDTAKEQIKIFQIVLGVGALDRPRREAGGITRWKFLESLEILNAISCDSVHVASANIIVMGKS